MRKRNKSDFKVKYDYQQICEELKVLDMEHVINQLDSSAQFMLIDKYLTYADIPYKNWMKYIWKFALSFFVVAIIILSVVIV